MGKRGNFDKNLSEVIGNNVRIQRTIRGLTRGDVAKHLGISYQQLQKYETGANRISAEFLYQLSELMDINLQELYPKSLETKKAFTPAEPKADPGAMRIFKAYSRITDPQVRHEILSLVSSLSKKDIS
jgi:transcriptional regulator with XRE-family HTH domain